jgi:hypothetical protein
MSDQADLIDEIILAMKRCWDLPADCNEGELYAYAEIVADKLRAGASRGELEDYLRNVQVEKMEMPDSRAPGEIVERATGLFNPSR